MEAYDLFKAIYLERGYRQRDVAQLILEKNLFGLDIDERAAQLTGFALMMKGRADDRRLFERGVKLNVMALVDSAGFDAEGLAKGVELWDYGLQAGGPHGVEAAVRARDDLWFVDSGAGGVGGEAAGAEAAERGDQPGPLCVGCAQALGAAGAAGRAAGGAVRRGGGESAVYGEQGHECSAVKKFAKGPLTRGQERPLRVLHRA